ncbi:ABC transporter substrate-binding protein [Demetria terragena]|uniref:ABC transporter substrate-binding protein n=1 Tax=Demetria terragena TaxID=63959 RepID=UPI0004782CD6|nr:ABC transporter substrate-binding protein [Demetria terragena]
MKTSRAFPALLAVAALGLASCGAPKDEAASSPDTATSGAKSCSPASMKTYQDGTLTIGTDNPAYAPWFQDNDPTNGKGYEAAVGYAIAKQLGYAKGDVTWAKVPFNLVITPGKKKFDFDLNQVSISKARAKAVDFSSGYYDVTQTVITTKGSKIANAKSMAALRPAKLGAQVGTTSYTAITEQIKPNAKPAVFDTNVQAVEALKNKQVDGIVVDLPTAFYTTSAQLENGVIVGQLPKSASKTEQLGAVLAKDSPLTDCVSTAVDTLRDNGTLKKLETQWLSRKGAPALS